MRAPRVALTALVAVALVPSVAGAANADAPGNDEVGGAVVLHLGDRVTQDTTEATTNAGDDALNEACGAPFVNGSVWYQYTPSASHNVVVDTTASDYETGVMVFTGTPTADSLLTCGPGEAGLHARAGVTYYVMAFSDTETIGGNLVVKLENAPTPRGHVTVAAQGAAFHGGAAKIHGTYRCRHNESFAGIDAHLGQRAGRLKIRGEGHAQSRHCDGKVHDWSARVVSPVGTYAKGRASAKVTIIVCGVLECRRDVAKKTLHLSWAPGPRTPMGHPSATSGTTQGSPGLSLQHRWPTR